MFTVSSFLLDHLRSRSRKLSFVFETYSWDYLPFPEPLSGNLSYDPRHAIKRWAGQNISFDLDGDTVTYDRQVLNVPSINKHIGKKFDDASLGLSNVDRSVAAYVLQSIAFGKTIQGQRLVVRIIPRNAPSGGDAASCFGHSIIVYVGRVNKPDGFTRSTGNISATQDLGTTVQQIPPNQHQPDCPLKFKGADCLGSETLAQKSATYKAAKVCNKSFAQCTEYSNTEFFQGLRIVQIESSFVHKSNESFFKKVLNVLPGISRKKTIVSNSLHDGGAYGQPIPLIYGRWLMKLIPLQFQDIGTSINFKMAACRGTIKDFLNIGNESVGFTQPIGVTKHLGEYGGVGTQTQDTVFPDQSFHSKLAYITGFCNGSEMEVEDPAPQITSVIAGASVRVAVGAQSNVAPGNGKVDTSLAGYANGTDGWSDNPVDIARAVINDPAILNIPDAYIGELATAITSIYTTGAIKDETNAERCLLPDTETSRAGVDYKRYNSTGLIGPLNFYGLGLEFLFQAQHPGGYHSREAEYEFFDPDAPPASLILKTVYRKRYTCNIIVNESKKAIDFLYDTLFACFRGFLRWDHLGRLVIDCERPADHSYLRADISSGATSIKVLDVTDWAPFDVILNLAPPLRGKILIGAHKLTSEVRTVTSATYSADGNGIPYSASSTSGTMTATAAGASLSGGSTSTPASGSVEIAGSCAVGDEISITIDGHTITITATQEDVDAAIDNLTMVSQLALAINAEPGLRDYIEAHREGSNPTSVGIYCKYGVLNFSTALEENHFAEIDDPSVAPTLAASSGTLAAGAYLVAYAYRNANGNTNLSPISPITLTANQQIDVTGISLPAGAISIDWFVSVEANSGTMLRVANNNGAGFSINALPNSTADDIPKRNTTGEEILRVMYSDAQRALAYADTARATHLDGSFEWPEGGRQSTINQVKTKYREAILDFAEKPLIVKDERHIEETGQTNSAEIDLSAVDNFNQAKRLCNGYLAKLRDGDFFFRWSSAGETLLLEIGDVVCLSDDSGEWRNVPVRIEEITYNSHFEVSFICRLYSTSQFDDAVLQTEVPLPSALVNFKSPPPPPEFNETDFPPDGLVQSTDGTAGITSIRGGAIIGDSIYPQIINVRLIRRGGVTVSENIASNLKPNDDGEVVFEFIASIDGLYTVEIEACNQWGCNTTKPTANIVIGLGSNQGDWIIPMIQLSGTANVGPSGGGNFNIP